MPALKVQLNLLKQATAIARAKLWQVGFVQQGVHSSLACAVALEGHKVGIHDLLDLVDGAYTITGCKADESVSGFVKVFHPASSAVRC